MNKQKRTYLQMQNEEATLASGRYNNDYSLSNPAPSAASTLLDAFRTALASSGAPLSDQPANEMATTAASN